MVEALLFAVPSTACAVGIYGLLWDAFKPDPFIELGDPVGGAVTVDSDVGGLV